MIKKIITLLLLFNSIYWIGCEDSVEPDKSGIEIYTNDINQESQLYHFGSMDFVSSYDLKFRTGNMSYLVEMNSAAGVRASVDPVAGFVDAVKPLTGYYVDTTDYVIGDQWMDISTYNPSDHSIQGNGTVYFIRTVDYEWVKLTVLSATPTTFNIQYALLVDDSTFSETHTKEVSYTADEPNYFDFTDGSSLIPDDWNMGFLTIPIFSPETESVFYMPTVLLNYELDVKVAILQNSDYESLTEIPENVVWLQDSNTERILNYTGENSAFVYHPEPPYNHRVIVENPDFVYLMSDGDYHYKLRFVDYSSGVILIEYEEI